MKIIVTGSRDWEIGHFVWTALDVFYGSSTLKVEDFTLVHGACPTGVDNHVDEWARAREWSSGAPIQVVRYPADWSRHGKAAGPLRNHKMILENLDADAVLAFPLGESKGTRGCMAYAEDQGLKVINLGDR